MICEMNVRAQAGHRPRAAWSRRRTVDVGARAAEAGDACRRCSSARSSRRRCGDGCPTGRGRASCRGRRSRASRPAAFSDPPVPIARDLAVARQAQPGRQESARRSASNSWTWSNSTGVRASAVRNCARSSLDRIAPSPRPATLEACVERGSHSPAGCSEMTPTCRRTCPCRRATPASGSCRRRERRRAGAVLRPAGPVDLMSRPILSASHGRSGAGRYPWRPPRRARSMRNVSASARPPFAR